MGLIGEQHLLDLCYQEDSTADVDVNIVMNADGDLIEIQGTAEGTPFSKDSLNRMLFLADKGIVELLKIQEQVYSEKKLGYVR